MPRISTVDVKSAPEGSRAILGQIKETFGRVPNFFASVAHSPAALKTVMGMFEALDGGELTGKPHEAIALRVGELHRCAYCTAVHTIKAKQAGATADEAIGFRRGESDDPKLKALLNVATGLVEKRGGLADREVQAARDAGWSDAELLEAVSIVAMNMYTNYVNALVQTELDFPAAPSID